MSGIPVIDMGSCTQRPEAFAHELGEALEHTGFARLTGHPIPLPLVAQVRHLTQELFTHPDETLQEWENPLTGRQTGFTPSRMEHARDVPESLADIKRFWHVRRVGNLFPDRLVPDFGPATVKLYESMEAMGLVLLEAMDRYLGHQGTPLRGMAVGGNSVLRVIDYPPVGDQGCEGAIRSGEHTDINLLTLLVPATAPGLQVKDFHDVWYDVEEQPDEIVVDGGDMLQLYTGGYLDEDWAVSGGRIQATLHRVVNPAPGQKDEGRNSFPFFIHPKETDFLDGRRGVRANHYLLRRLLEIGVLDEAICKAFFDRYPLVPHL